MPLTRTHADPSGRGSKGAMYGPGLLEELESRIVLAAHTIGNFFPLDVGSTWNYAGTYNGHPATAVATANAGPALSGTPTTKLSTVVTSDGTSYTDSRFFANTTNGLTMFRQDLLLPTLVSRTSFSGGMLLIPSTVNDGQVIHFNVALSATSADPAHASWTGIFSGDVTVFGLEEINTSAGSFEALRLNISGTLTENGSTGWTASGTVDESRWLVVGVGTVRVDWATALHYSDGAEFAARYDLGLTSSSRLGSAVDLQITGKGVVIPFGDTSPGAPDGTNFTGIDINGGTKTRVFRITNTSGLPITLAAGNQGLVTLTGANTSDFVVVRQPLQVIQPGASTVFSVRFDPSGTGFRFATVSVNVAGSTGNPFTFDIRGTGIFIGRINVNGGTGVAITSGQTATNFQTGTKFGNAAADGTNSIEHTFTILNTGVGNLVLNGATRVVISGTEASDFTVSQLPSNSIVPGSSTTFRILFDPSALGTRTAIVTIMSNDRFTPLFSFTIRGTGV